MKIIIKNYDQIILKYFRLKPLKNFTFILNIFKLKMINIKNI
jgi:hypothetical protein